MMKRMVWKVLRIVMSKVMQTVVRVRKLLQRVVWMGIDGEGGVEDNVEDGVEVDAEGDV